MTSHIDARSSFFDLIWSVATKEMEMVGQDPQGEMREVAMYLEAVRRIQAWTFDQIAETHPPSDPMHTMFLELAKGVRDVPDIDLWMGESGASGGTRNGPTRRSSPVPKPEPRESSRP